MDILETLQQIQGYWKYDGGRFVAKVGDKVTDTVVDCSELTCIPFWSGQLCRDVVAKMLNQMFPELGSDWENSQLIERQTAIKSLFVCSTNDNREMAYEVARQLGGAAIHTQPTYEVVEHETESIDNGWERLDDPTVEKKGQQLDSEIPKNATILFVEDVVTTFKSTIEMFRAVSKVLSVLRRDVTVLPYVLCLVNCSGEKKVPEFEVKGTEPIQGSQEIISLAEVNVRTWDTVLVAEAELFSDEERASMGFNAVGGLKAVCPQKDWDKLVKGDKR